MPSFVLISPTSRRESVHSRECWISVLVFTTAAAPILSLEAQQLDLNFFLVQNCSSRMRHAASLCFWGNERVLFLTSCPTLDLQPARLCFKIYLHKFWALNKDMKERSVLWCNQSSFHRHIWLPRFSKLHLSSLNKWITLEAGCTSFGSTN